MAFYKDGIISIPNVTGDVVITATAVQSAQPYTNALLEAKEFDGSITGDGKGYVDGKYISGNPQSSGYKDNDANCTATGAIPYTTAQWNSSVPIYVKAPGVTISPDVSHHRVCMYEDYSYAIYKAPLTFSDSSVVVDAIGTGYYKITPAAVVSSFANCNCIRFSFGGSLAGGIISIGNPIE